jgi:RNA polymerase sigma factor (sigma-70 family)
MKGENEYYEDDELFSEYEQADISENEDYLFNVYEELDEDEEFDFDAEENCTLDEKGYDGSFASNPYVKESTTLTKEERQQAYKNIIAILNNPNSTQKEIDDAKSRAVCYMYALIRTLVMRYCSSYVNNNNYEDYVSEGMIAVLNHLPNYNPDSSSPSTYFYQHIKHDLIVSLSESRGTTRHYNSKIAKIKKAQNDLIKAGKPATEAMIAIMTGEPILTVKRVLETIDSQYIQPLEELRNVSGRTLTPDEEFSQKEMSETLNNAIDYLLSEDEALVIRHKFGFIDNVPKNYIEISEATGLTKDDVKKKITSGLRKLKDGKIPPNNVVNMSEKEKRIYEIKNNREITENFLSDIFPEFSVKYRKENRYSQNQMYYNEEKSSAELDALMNEDFDDE